MAFLGMFSEPIMTSRGMIVGRDFDGTPHYVQPFNIPNPYSCNNSNNYCNKKKEEPYKTFTQMYEEAEQSRQERREKLKDTTSNNISTEELKNQLKKQLREEIKQEMIKEQKQQESNQNIIDINSDDESGISVIASSVVSSIKTYKTNTSRESHISSKSSVIKSIKSYAPSSRTKPSSVSSMPTLSSISDATSRTSTLDLDDATITDTTSVYTDCTDEEIYEHYINSESEVAKCKSCTSCHGGVISVGVVFVIKTKSKTNSNDRKFILVNNNMEKSYTEFTQKLRSLEKIDRIEPLSDAVHYMLKHQLNINYTLTNNDYFDMMVHDNKHVHRVYIIESEFDIIELNKFCKKKHHYADIKSFSLRKILSNGDEFKKNKIMDMNDEWCNINKRLQKIIVKYYTNYYDE
jgi:hypothetical protein